MLALAVSPIVNNARVDDPRCCEAWDGEDVPQKLVVTRSEPDQQKRQPDFGL
jgi:hypothetical protein